MNIVTSLVMSLVMSLWLLSGTIKERPRGTRRAEEPEPKGTWGDMQGNRNLYLAPLHGSAWLTCNRTTDRCHGLVWIKPSLH